MGLGVCVGAGAMGFIARSWFPPWVEVTLVFVLFSDVAFGRLVLRLLHGRTISITRLHECSARGLFLVF